MFSALELDLRPANGIGIFEIGSSLWHVLDVLRHNSTLFPRIDVKFDAEASTSNPVLVHIPPHIDLLFAGKHQRLRTISLRRLRDPNPPVLIRYKDTVLSSISERLIRSVVSRHFGPTYPGESLQYPGVSFSFEEDGSADGFTENHPNIDDRNREIKRVIVTQKTDGDRDALDEVQECPTMAGSIKQVVVKVHDGAIFHLYPSPRVPIKVTIGITNAQDLIQCFGSPLRIHQKEDDRMAIHATTKRLEGEETGYFYNYFQHGVDFFLSSTTHIVYKIILHSNVPGSPMFQRYQRCPWEIQGEPEDEEDDSPPRVGFYDKFDVVSHFLNPSRDSVPSMVLDRAEDEMLTLPGSFTRLVGFDGVILEVTESGQITTVTLF